MTKCKWCEKETHDEYLYCNYNCMKMFEKFNIRKIIIDFAEEMELAMQEKDKLGYTNIDKSLEFLVNKLKEEMEEVNTELDILPSENIAKELLHEAIMVMLVRKRIEDYEKHAKLDTE